MRADLAVRHNAAVGAIVGLAVGDVVLTSAALPPVIHGGPVDLPTWSRHGDRSFSQAEQLLNGRPVDMGLSAVDMVATAVGLSAADASPPLLGDPDAVLICRLVRDALSGSLDLAIAEPCDVPLGVAVEAVRSTTGFVEAIEKVSATEADPAAGALAGALAGLRWGPATIPASWATTVHGPVGGRTYGLRQLRRLAERLLQLDAPMPPEPRRSLGPREVAPGLWLSNLHAVPRFLADHPDGAVISLCPTTGAFDNHPLRREFALHDAGGSSVNPLLSAVVDEVLQSIAAFHAEDRHVLVHCHHGASRTGLILRAWLMHELGLGVDDATTEAQVRWPKTSTWNRAFCAEIERRGERSP